MKSWWLIKNFLQELLVFQHARHHCSKKKSVNCDDLSTVFIITSLKTQWRYQESIGDNKEEIGELHKILPTNTNISPMFCVKIL